MKSKENGNYAMTTPPRNKYHLQVGIKYPTYTLDKTHTDKPCVKGAAQSGLCASITASQSIICAAPLPFLLWSNFTALKCPS